MASSTSTRTEDASAVRDVSTVQDFSAVLNLPASPATVSALFTSAAGVSRWWGPTEGDGAVGGTLATTFGNYGVNRMRVLEAGPSRVVWESIVADDDGLAAGSRPTSHALEWLGTKLEFTIIAAGTGTELHFRHAGLTPQLECWDECFAGWTHFMRSIEAFARTGLGTPFQA